MKSNPRQRRAMQKRKGQRPNRREDREPAQSSAPSLAAACFDHLLHVYQFLTTPPQELPKLLAGPRDLQDQLASHSRRRSPSKTKGEDRMRPWCVMHVIASSIVISWRTRSSHRPRPANAYRIRQSDRCASYLLASAGVSFMPSCSARERLSG
jgi:hypothetical protein